VGPHEVEQVLLLGGKVVLLGRLVVQVAALHGSFSQSGSAALAGRTAVLHAGDGG
jgi:hypothetical protein